MRRSMIGLDRFLGVVVGVVLVLVGLLGIAWWQGVLLHRLPRAGSVGRSTGSGIRSGVGQSWWPYVAGLVGLVLAILGTIWLVEHFVSRAVHSYRLAGSDQSGRLKASSGALLSAAEEQLTDIRGIRSASGSMTTERGALIADLSVTAEPGTDLRTVAAEIDRTVTDLASSLDDPAVAYRTQLSVARRQRVST